MVRILFLSIILGVFSVAAHAAVLLNASFNDKPVDVPIGTGGAEVGEPTSVHPDISAVVRSTPMASNSLELIDMADFGSPSARFDFIGLTEVTEGTVSISLDLWFAEAEGYTIFVRESQYASKSFLTMTLTGSLHVQYGDADSPGNFAIGTYELGRSIPMLIVFDMDAGTYDLFWDGEQLLDNETHGITDAGVGAVIVGVGHDSDLLGTVYVDNIYVTDGALFEDGFEAGDTSGWSDVLE